MMCQSTTTANHFVGLKSIFFYLPTMQFVLTVSALIFLVVSEQVNAWVGVFGRQRREISTSHSAAPSDGAKIPSERTLNKFLGRLKRMKNKVDWEMVEQSDDDISADEAQASAAIYLNPATTSLSPDIKVTWEPQVSSILTQLRKIGNPDRPMMIGVVGIPGSGKSTSCEVLATYLGAEKCAIIPMDGYHFPLNELAKFPNAADAIYRRGAPDTFNPSALERDLERIAFGSQEEIPVPGFDHAKGDPEEGKHIFVRDKHEIVICEGIYLLHDNDGWENIQRYFDWTIFIDSDLEACLARLKERNKCIPGYTPEEIETRVDEVDRVNCEVAQEAARRFASQVVTSCAP